jgi:transposase
MSDAELVSLSPAALVALVRALEAELAAVRAELAALREQVRPPAKTPENSSVPPAKAFKRDRAARHRAAKVAGEPAPKRGPKHGHPGTSRARVAATAVDVVLPCRPLACGACGHALPRTGGQVVGRRQVIELPPIRPLVIEARRYRLHCGHCQHHTVGVYPSGFGTQGRFGPQLQAQLALWHEQQHVGYDRLVGLLQEVFGLTISEGAVVDAVARVGAALAPAAAAIAATVRQAPVVGSDETSARVDGVNYWEWVFQTDTAAYHVIQRRRNTEVVLSFLNGATPQVWVSDLWKPQLLAPTAAYQICLAHQLRDLKYAIDAERGEARAGPRAWAQTCRALLQEAIHLRHQEQAGQLSPAAFASAVTAVETTCDQLLTETLPPGWSADLQRRFVVHRPGLLLFLHRADVPPTNNASERSLRPSVVHRKVTGGFRSETAAQAYASLRTVADTARKRGQSVYAQLLQAMGAPLAGLPANPLPTSPTWLAV